MINRLSHSRLVNISFTALVTISYFFPRSLCSLVTKYDIVSRAIKLISVVIDPTMAAEVISIRTSGGGNN